MAMAYLLDACVICEPVQRRPSAKVISFLNALPAGSAYLSVLTLGEVRNGIERLPESTRRRELSRWFDSELLGRFRGCILPIDESVALRWASMRAVLEARGRVLPAIDSLVAATALVHGMKLVTRNEDDFDGTGVEIVNPWK